MNTIIEARKNLLHWTRCIREQQGIINAAQQVLTTSTDELDREIAAEEIEAAIEEIAVCQEYESMAREELATLTGM